MSKNKKPQVVESIEELESDDLELDEMTPEDEELEGEMEEVVVEKKSELTPEEKEKKVLALRIKLKAAKADKNTKLQKKLRRALRNLDYYISKERDKMMDMDLPETAEATTE